VGDHAKFQPAPGRQGLIGPRQRASVQFYRSNYLRINCFNCDGGMIKERVRSTHIPEALLQVRDGHPRPQARVTGAMLLAPSLHSLEHLLREKKLTGGLQLMMSTLVPVPCRMLTPTSLLRCHCLVPTAQTTTLHEDKNFYLLSTRHMRHHKDFFFRSSDKHSSPMKKKWRTPWRQCDTRASCSKIVHTDCSNADGMLAISASVRCAMDVGSAEKFNPNASKREDPCTMRKRREKESGNSEEGELELSTRPHACGPSLRCSCACLARCRRTCPRVAVASRAARLPRCRLR
jgi:hypothetical protein